MEKDTENGRNKSNLFVVGVGASAGGLDALSKFLTNFNGTKAEVCIVIVMHLSPKYKSQLASILDKRCKWPVISAKDNLKLSAHNIYVTPQNKQIRIKGNSLILEDLSENLQHTPSIDNFFISLAGMNRKAIGVILSGFGKDGSLGISAIKDNGGFTIAQLPETSEHRDMPEASIATGHVDLVIPAEQMFDSIVQYIYSSRTIASTVNRKSAVDSIFELLEKRSGTDFSMYKPTTIMRRVNHRINLLQLKSILEYYQLIMDNPIELDNLFDSVLIGVTEFFRDLEAYGYLRDQLKLALKEKQPGDDIRIWSVGCATGEEPYSIAILLYELLGEDAKQYHIQIFASDIDERALNFGRKAIYSQQSLANVPVELIHKYFDKTDQLHYEVIKEVKQHTLFTRHDITNDPPFVKLDMIVCRNLLIYFNNTLQKQTFQIFHYSLKPKGLLFLGKSESVSVAPDLFNKADKGKVFKKADSSLSYELKFSRFKSKQAQTRLQENKVNNRNMNLVDVAKETLYYKFEDPFVIINEKSEIKEVHGSLRLYLEISQGTMNVNLDKMVNPELTTIVKAVLAQVKKTGVSHTSHVVKFNLYDQSHYVRIKIIPLIYRILDAQYYMVIFQRIEPSEGYIEFEKKLQTSDFENMRIKELEDELASTKEHLQIFTEELESANEELQTINEELQSTNEELKSSNEEMETGNEELQSANEELNTANQELRMSNDLLIEKEKELKAEKHESERNKIIYQTMADHMPNGTVGILNDALEIEYIGGEGLEKNNLLKDDVIGQVLPDLNPSAKQRKLLKGVLAKTLNGESCSLEFEYGPKYYALQTIPFEMPDQDSNKVMYLSQDITEIKKNALKYRMSLEAANIVIFEFDFDKKQFLPNVNLSKLLSRKEDKAIPLAAVETLLYDTDKQEFKAQMKAAIQSGIIDDEISLQIEGQVKWVRIFGEIIFGLDNKPLTAVAAAIDITEDKKLLQQIKESEERFKRVADSAPICIWMTDKNEACTYVNKLWLKFTGTKLVDNLGRKWLNAVHEEDAADAMASYENAFKKKKAFSIEYRLKKHDGTYEWFLVNGIPKFDDMRNFDGYLGSSVNINEQIEFSNELEDKVDERTKELKSANDELVKLNINLEEFAYMASHDLKEPLRKIRTFSSLMLDNLDNEKKVLNYGSKIESSAKRMSNLIDNILEYSKIEKNSVKNEEVSLDTLLEEVKSDLTLIIDEQNVIINSEPLGTIKAIHINIYQLFSNLIRNAIKFNIETPQIDIYTEMVKGSTLPERFNAKPNRKFKKVTFKDNGIGLGMDKRDYIFKPFKKLNSSSSYSGTGIGLAICSKIMGLNDGFIDVESKLGEGSSFILYFPNKKG